MVTVTPVYGLPYPDNTDQLKAAVKDIPASLAQQLEATLQAFGGIAAPAAWTALTLNGATAAQGAPWCTPARSKAGVWVELRGLVKATAALTAPFTLCTLPAGWRPLVGDRRFGGSSSVLTLVDVQTDGDVVLSTSLSINQTFSLDQIRFRVD